MKRILLAILVQIIFTGVAGAAAIKDPALIRDIKFLANTGEIRVVVNTEGALETLPSIEVQEERLLKLDIQNSFTEPEKRKFNIDDPDIERVEVSMLEGEKVRITLSLPEPYESGLGRVWKTDAGFIIALKRRIPLPVSASPESDLKVEESFPTIFKSEKNEVDPEISTYAGKDDSHSSPVIRMISSLALVIGIFLIGAFLLRKKLLGKGVAGSGNLIKVLERGYIDVKKSIAIVDVAGEILVVGTCEGGITMLTKLENNESIARVMSGQKKGGALAFSDIVKKASGDLNVAEGLSGSAADTPLPETLLARIKKLRPIK